MDSLEKFFDLKKNQTTIQREPYAGLILFLTMSYILAVNPEILSSTGMDRGAVFCATAFAAFIGTITMALLANYPLGLAPAMGLNAFFAYSVVGMIGYSWQFALLAIVVEGIMAILLSASSIRGKIFTSIPLALKYGMGAGIGLGTISYVILNCRIKGRVNWVLWTIALLFVAKYLYL